VLYIVKNQLFLPVMIDFFLPASLGEHCNETLPGLWPIIEDMYTAASCSSAAKKCLLTQPQIDHYFEN
jgi:hypothetical protein